MSKLDETYEMPAEGREPHDSMTFKPATDNQVRIAHNKLGDQLVRFQTDFVGFIWWAFPWGEGELKGKRPNKWQLEMAERISEEARKNRAEGKGLPYKAIRMAIVSGHGIGKSAMVSWIILWIMATRPFCNGVVTASNAPQLHGKTWGEVAKWHNLFILKDQFDYSGSKGSMWYRHKKHKETWKCVGFLWDEANPHAFAGLHAQNSTPFYIFDEASEIPNVIFDVAYGGLTDGEPMWFCFGNPVKNTGDFRECFRHKKHRWITKQIDSRDVEITNKEELQEWIDDRGETSDFCKVKIFGMFPTQASGQYIGEDIVDAAFGRHLDKHEFEFAPTIFGIDPAYMGEDDFVVMKRQGLYSEVVLVESKTDDTWGMCGRIFQLMKQHDCDYVFIDMAYGTGINDGLRDLVKMHPKSIPVRLVHFGAKSPESEFKNARCCMWGRMKKWLEQGGAIPKDHTLHSDLTAVELVETVVGKTELEPKTKMKNRGLPSPDRADALALTFAGGNALIKQSGVVETQDYRTKDHPFMSNDKRNKLYGTGTPDKPFGGYGR